MKELQFKLTTKSDNFPAVNSEAMVKLDLEIENTLIAIVECFIGFLAQTNLCETIVVLGFLEEFVAEIKADLAAKYDEPENQEVKEGTNHRIKTLDNFKKEIEKKEDFAKYVFNLYKDDLNKV